MKISLFGAGSAQFGYGTLGDIFQSKILEGAEIALMDIDPESLEKVRSTASSFIEENKLPFSISATTSSKEALKNADFVIISIEVGNRFELWDMDWKVPMEFGINQVYGENGGPGGLFHALRIIPPILDICSEVDSTCPDATVFCYSNPMTAIVTTVTRKYPNMKFIGMCHEIASLPRYLPSILNTEYSNLEIRAAGLNHFSILLEASYKDTKKDAYPDIRKNAPDFFKDEPGYSDIWNYTRQTGKIPETEGSVKRFISESADNSYKRREWQDRTLFKEILRKFNYLPITSDSHLGEYIGWARESADLKGILDFYSFYRYSLSKREAKIELELKERVVPIMEGIVSDSGYEEYAVNILNDGYIPDLPSWIAVEVPAIIRGNGIEGITFPNYPKGFGALLRNYTGVYDLTAEAVLTGKREYVIQALLVNPVISNIRRLEEMVDLMLEQQNKWLSYIN
ncbi:MAG: alpha-glucosidase [Spirochaetia bacterium]|jgi:alpha-galactosidase|nr:alpha-glucosidase [Spirochaetia bacterium]